MTPITSAIVRPDGRTVSYAEYGDPAGRPLFGLHGMPGSHLLLQLFAPAAQQHGLRLIAPDRPGSSASSPAPANGLLDYPHDIAALADALNIERFAVLGLSGGGPYALACAAGLPHRLTCAAVVSGIGPLTSWRDLRSMQRGSQIIFGLSRYTPWLGAGLLALLMRISLPLMERQVRRGKTANLPLAPEIVALSLADAREALRQGSQGIVHDMRAYWQPWGFDLSQISVPVYLWHGESDVQAPSSLAHAMAAQIPHCTATFFPGEGHVDPLLKHLDLISATIAAAHGTSSIRRGQSG